jgi:acetyl esterase/lipase
MVVLVALAAVAVGVWCGKSGTEGGSHIALSPPDGGSQAPSNLPAQPDGGTPPPSPDAGLAVDDAGSPRPRESVAVVSACGYVPPASRACPSNLVCTQDQTYATLGGTALKMDVVRPSSGGPHPLIVVMHGGGFVGGDKGDLALDLIALARHGYVTASVNYRLMSPDGTNSAPTAIEDVRCAVRVLRANAASWNLDPSRVGVYGASAGGVLSGILGTEDDVAGLDDPACPAPSEPVKVQAAAPLYGAFNTHPGYPMGSDAQTNSYAALWLHQPPDDPQIDAEVSAIDHLDPGDPPFLLVHGDHDTTIPIAQSENMRDALQAGGAPATLVVVSGEGHGFDPFDGAAAHQEAACTILAFFDRWL